MLGAVKLIEIDWPLPVAAAAAAVACAAISPLVVARRWAFVGEGVSHSGYGGAGMIWLLSLLLPGIAFLREPAGVMLGVALASLVTALAIGRMTRSRRLGFLGFDAAVGIVLTGSLAFGFLARSIYQDQAGLLPVEAQSLLFGDVRGVRPEQALVSLAIALAVLAGLWLCAKETHSYAFDPELAEVGGVPASAVHYALLITIAAIVIATARLVGVVLVTALLVLPGATGALLGGNLARMYAGSLGTALLGVAGAVLLQSAWPTLPLGPLIVLTLVAGFLLAAGASKLRFQGREPAPFGRVP